MANLRYARSGHRVREVVRAEKLVGKIASPRSLFRLGVLVAAVAFPALVAALLPMVRSVERTPVALAVRADVAARAPAPVAAVAAAVVAPIAVVAPAQPASIVDALRPDEALSTALARNGASADDVSSLVRALKSHLEVRSLRAGLGFVLQMRRDAGALSGRPQLAFLELKTLASNGVPRTIRATRQPEANAEPDGDARFAIEVIDAPIETKVEGIAGSVRSSLYQAMLAAGEDAVLVGKFAEVFAWNIDFYRQTQKGDEFRVLVEKQYAGGRFLGYGKVLAAEYVNAGAVHRGFIFTSADGKHSGTYDDEGDALQRTFLKSPMEIARLTSSYGMRFHPVLGHNKKHEGVDYGAAAGTPVWSVADGIVKEAHFSRTAGNMIIVQHMNGISTEYFHLSRYAEGLQKGARVKQKQVIGFVGSTGMSTGPHLHFGMLKSGGHVDPNKQKFPNARPVPKEYRAEFDKLVAPMLAELKALDRV